MFRSYDRHGIELCNREDHLMIDWNKYDAWKLDAPEQDTRPKCVYVKCDNQPKKGEDYCSSCIRDYECHQCCDILPEENEWQDIRPSFFVCSKCYAKITG